AFVVGQNETIRGNVNFRSNMLDLNEFMSDEEGEVVAEDSSTYAVIPIPRNIDFVLSSNIKTTRLMDLTLSNATGDIIIKDGVANLSGLRFNMLGGAFVVNGSYDTRDIEHPR